MSSENSWKISSPPRRGYIKYSKISNTFHCLFSNEMLLIKAENLKMLARIANRKTLIRLLLQKQSDLGLLWLSRHFLHQLVLKFFVHLL